MKKQKLLTAIFKFLNVCYNCYSGTNYVDDRVAFQSDIVICAKWVLDIENNIDIQIVISDILDTKTVKHILDYYKRGSFGDEQAVAYEILKAEVKNIYT